MSRTTSDSYINVTKNIRRSVHMLFPLLGQDSRNRTTCSYLRAEVFQQERWALSLRPNASRPCGVLTPARAAESFPTDRRLPRREATPPIPHPHGCTVRRTNPRCPKPVPRLGL